MCFRIKIFKTLRPAAQLFYTVLAFFGHNSVLQKYFCVSAGQKVKGLTPSSMLLALSAHSGWLVLVEDLSTSD